MTKEEVNPVNCLLNSHNANRSFAMAALHAGMSCNSQPLYAIRHKSGKGHTQKIRDYRLLQSLVFSDLLEQTIRTLPLTVVDPQCTGVRCHSCRNVLAGS